MMACLLALFMVFPQPRIEPRALEWFAKGEAMIDTPQAYSEEQARCFAAALELEPDFAAARYNLALIRVRQGRFDEALKHLDALILLEPDDPRGLLMRAQIHAQNESAELAEKDLIAALALAPGDASAWRDLGLARLSQARHGEAIEALEESRRLNPAQPDLDFDLAMAYAGTGRDAEAVAHLKAYLQHRPDDFEGLFNLAALLRRQGDLEGALQSLQRAQRVDPSQTSLAADIGFLLLDLGRPEEAAPWLEKSDQAAAMANLGLIAGRRGEHDRAAVYFNRALEKEPSNGELWAGLADSLYALGKAEEAADAYRKAMELGVADAAILLNLGTIHANAGRNEEAALRLKEGLALDPDSAAGHFNLGVVLERLGDSDGALQHYRAALGHGADDARLHFRMAVLTARAGQAEEALRHLAICLEKDAPKYLPLIEEELLNIHSDLDSIRYTTPFAALLKKHRSETPLGGERP